MLHKTICLLKTTTALLDRPLLSKRIHVPAKSVAAQPLLLEQGLEGPSVLLVDEIVIEDAGCE